jgi:hypothetical protein
MTLYNIEASNINNKNLLKLTNNGNEININLKNNYTDFNLGLSNENYIIKNNNITYKTTLNNYNIINSIDNYDLNTLDHKNLNNIYYNIYIPYNIETNRYTEYIYKSDYVAFENSDNENQFDNYTFYNNNLNIQTDKPNNDAGFMFNIINKNIDFKILLKSIQFNINSTKNYIIKNFKLYAVITKNTKYDCYLLLDKNIQIQNLDEIFEITDKIYTDKFIILVNSIQINNQENIELPDQTTGRYRFLLDYFTLKFDNIITYDNFNLDFNHNSILNLKLLNTENIFINNIDVNNYIKNIINTVQYDSDENTITILKKIVKLHFDNTEISNKLIHDSTTITDYNFSSQLYDIIKSLLNIKIENDMNSFYLPNLGNNHTKILNSSVDETFIVGIKKNKDLTDTDFNFKFYYDGNLTTKHLIDLNNINKPGLLYFNKNSNIIQYNSNLIDNISIKNINFKNITTLTWNSNLNNFTYNLNKYKFNNEFNNELQPKICDLFSIKPNLDIINYINIDIIQSNNFRIETLKFIDYEINQPVIGSTTHIEQYEKFLLNNYRDSNLLISGLLGFHDSKIKSEITEYIGSSGNSVNHHPGYDLNVNYNNIIEYNNNNNYLFRAKNNSNIDYFEYIQNNTEELINISFEILDNLDDYPNVQTKFNSDYYKSGNNIGVSLYNYDIDEYKNKLNKLNKFKLYIDDQFYSVCNINNRFLKQNYYINKICNKIKIEFYEILITTHSTDSTLNFNDYNNCIILKNLNFKFKSNFNYNSLKINKPININELTIDTNLKFNNKVDIKFIKNINEQIGECNIIKLELKNINNNTCILKNNLELGSNQNFNKIYLDDNSTPIINITNNSNNYGIVGINMLSDEFNNINNNYGLIVKPNLTIYDNNQYINISLSNLNTNYKLILPDYKQGIDKYLKIIENNSNIIKTEWVTLTNADIFTSGNIYLGKTLNYNNMFQGNYYTNNFSNLSCNQVITNENLIHIRKLFVGPDEHQFFNGDHDDITNIINNNTLTVAGQIYATNDIFTDSDLSYKYNLEKIIDVKNKINNLNGYTFNRNDTTLEKRFTGLIAQDVEKVLPEAVLKKCDGKLRVMYGNLAGLFIECFKDLYNEIDILKKELNNYKEKL